MEIIIFLVVVLIIVMIIADNFISSRTSVEGRDALNQFAQNHGLYSESDHFWGTYHGRDFKLVSSRSDWESNISNVATMQVDLCQKSETFFRLVVRSNWEKDLHIHEYGFYKEVMDLSVQPKIIHKVDIDTVEIEPKKLFKFQSEPEETVEQIIEQYPNLKYKLVEVDSILKEINNYSPTYKLDAGILIVEFCFRGVGLTELEIVASNLSNLAVAIEKSDEIDSS